MIVSLLAHQLANNEERGFVAELPYQLDLCNAASIFPQ